MLVRVGGVADVDRVVEQGAGIVPALQLGADALQPVFSHGGQVGRGDAGGRPFGFGKRAIAENVLVERRGLFAGGGAQRVERMPGSNGMILRWRAKVLTRYASPMCGG